MEPSEQRRGIILECGFCGESARRVLHVDGRQICAPCIEREVNAGRSAAERTDRIACPLCGWRDLPAIVGYLPMRASDLCNRCFGKASHVLAEEARG